MGARRKLRRKLTHVYKQASTHTRIKAGVAAPSPSFPRSHQSRGARRPRRRTHVPRQSRENIRKRIVRRAKTFIRERCSILTLSFSPPLSFRAGRRNTAGEVSCTLVSHLVAESHVRAGNSSATGERFIIRRTFLTCIYTVSLFQPFHPFFLSSRESPDEFSSRIFIFVTSSIIVSPYAPS